MKNSLFITIGLLISIMCYTQKRKVIDPKPKGMLYCPQGQYNNVKMINGDSVIKIVQLNSFWISNEITNQEYREFYNHIKNTPKDTIYTVNVEHNSNNRPFIEKHLHSNIINDLIDNSIWDKDSEKDKYENYFINPLFDDYPVLGVTYNGAMFYCIWKTEQENKSLNKQGKPFIHDYRIPLETEWEYAATFESTEKNDINLHEVLKNKLEICEMSGNVSEWTSSTERVDDNINQVVRGGSWKSEPTTNFRLLINPNEATNYIGFRIVRSCIEQE